MREVLAIREAAVAKRGKPDTKPEFRTIEEEVRFWNLMGACLDDECSDDERSREKKSVQLDFKNGLIGTSRTPILDEDDDHDVW
jgi:hypothetical protein